MAFTCSQLIPTKGSVQIRENRSRIHVCVPNEIQPKDKRDKGRAGQKTQHFDHQPLKLYRPPITAKSLDELVLPLSAAVSLRRAAVHFIYPRLPFPPTCTFVTCRLTQPPDK